MCPAKMRGRAIQMVTHPLWEVRGAIAPVARNVKKRVPMFARAATQFACRAKVSGDRGCKWMIRETQDNDAARHPVAKRRSVRTTTRRAVLGSPRVGSSADQWPGKMASSRPSVSFPEGGP